ncbi:tafazzin-like [Dysidea avara]|uniref:tafazzin-like n=1 Tax=Dysidea avara TaxID=196820 RepID=UPI00332B26BC
MVGNTPTDWPYPSLLSSLKKPSWRIPSNIICGATYLLSKTFLKLAVNIQQKNTDRITHAIYDRPKGTPLITVSNHSSCIDDPLLWGMVPIRRNFINHVRWIPGAKEILYKNFLLSYFFSRSQTIPVVRGDGVYQKAVDYCITHLNEGGWVHFFPEGKVNLTDTTMRLKWGVGRLIADMRRNPIVLPFWHSGMESILPDKTYVPRLFKKITVFVGDPIDFSQLLETHRKQKSNAVVVRKQITDIIQDRFAELKQTTEELHAKWIART